jgi:hypothetical protein
VAGDRTQATAVDSWRLIAWAIALPLINAYFFISFCQVLSVYSQIHDERVSYFLQNVLLVLNVFHLF